MDSPHHPGFHYSSLTGLRGMVLRFYGRTLDVLVSFLVFLMLLTLFFSVWNLLRDVYSAFGYLRQGTGIRTLVSDVLSVFVLIELFRTFTDYLEFHRIRLRVLSEVAIVFILRELFIGLYANRIGPLDLLATAAILAVLVAARIAAVRFAPKPESPD